MASFFGPSPAQQKTLDDLKLFIASHAYSPTIAELAEMAGITNTAVSERVGGLLRKGCVTNRPGIARCLVPVVAPEQLPEMQSSANAQVNGLELGEDLQKLRQEAERYRYLRDHGAQFLGSNQWYSGEDLDERVDAGIARTTNTKAIC
jgi:hypothetical protein